MFVDCRFPVGIQMLIRSGSKSNLSLPDVVVKEILGPLSIINLQTPIYTFIGKLMLPKFGKLAL